MTRPNTILTYQRGPDQKKDILLEQLFDSISKVNEIPIKDSRLSLPRESKDISKLLYESQ